VGMIPCVHVKKVVSVISRSQHTRPSEFVPSLEKPLEWVRDEQPMIQPATWRYYSVRTGLVGRKVGMMQIFDYWGKRFPVTVVEFDGCQVVQVKNEVSPRGFVGLQLGFGEKKIKNFSKPLLGHFKKAGVLPKPKLTEFQVTPDAILPVGYTMSARHFVPGQFVDVKGITVGKGFQGGMKRHNFSGLCASHGVSLAHRAPGSIGMNQTPGRVFKGKKMAGHMGVEGCTMMNLKVYKVDIKRDLLYVIGSIPGHEGNYVTVRDAHKKKDQFKEASPPPFPTFIPQADTPDEEIMEATPYDPFAYD